MAQQWGDKAYSYAKAKDHGGLKEKEDWTQDADQVERTRVYKEKLAKIKGGLQKIDQISHNNGTPYQLQKGDTLYGNVLKGYFNMNERTAFFVIVKMLEAGVNVDLWRPGDSIWINANGSLGYRRLEEGAETGQIIAGILEPTVAAGEDDEDDDAYAEPKAPSQQPEPPSQTPAEPLPQIDEPEPRRITPPIPGPESPSPTVPSEPAVPGVSPTPEIPPEAPPPEVSESRESLDDSLKQAEKEGGKTSIEAVEIAETKLKSISALFPGDAEYILNFDGQYYLSVEGKKHYINLSSNNPNIIYIIVENTPTLVGQFYRAPGVIIDLSTASKESILKTMNDPSKQKPIIVFNKEWLID